MLGMEGLESRVVMYSATGNAWLNPAVVTISFMPDGTDLGGVQSNMQSAFDSNPYLAGRWKDEILKAAQVWAQQTNVNFVVVPDDGAPVGEGGFQQGSPNQGDIRIGGFNYGTSTLAEATMPPAVNNYSIAGDVVFNTGMGFNIGTTYDLFTVASHEIGHALGLGESSAYSSAMMWPTYVGRKMGLAADDVAGIRSIYSGGLPRSPDAYSNLNSSLNAAANVNSFINQSAKTGLVTSQDITSAGQADHFSFVAPAGSGGQMTVAVQSDGLSLLSSRVTVYAADKTTILGSAVGMKQYGSTVSVSLNGVVDGATYYVRVQGAEPTALGTGRYALGLGFNGAAVPRQSSSMVGFVEGSPRTSGGGTANQSELVSAIPVILGIGPDTGTSASDGVTSASALTIRGIAAPGHTISVYDDGVFLGTTTADASGDWLLDARSTPFTTGQHFLTAQASYEFDMPPGLMIAGVMSNGNAAISDSMGQLLGYDTYDISNGRIDATTESSRTYTVVVDTAAPAAPTVGGLTSFTGRGWGGTYLSDSKTQTFFGRAEAGSRVTVTANGSTLGEVVADRHGNWNFAIASGLVAGQTYAIAARATDLAGHSSVVSQSLSLSQQRERSTSLKSDLGVSNVGILGGLVSGIGDLLSVGSSPTISGRAKAGTRVAVMLDSIVIGMADVDLLGNWSFKTHSLASGTYSLSFRVFETGGNYGNAGGTLSILV